jgi:hypothetical protein
VETVSGEVVKKEEISMRKRIIGQGLGEVAAAEPGWMDLEGLAQVEITSEDVDFSIESALIPGTSSGWRAAQPGEQTIRLLFDEPRRLRRIHLMFHEGEQERTQEFVLRWSPDRGQSYREIVRQQYNFSPPEATREVEDYDIDLDGVTALELKIVPDISGGSARASLAQLRVA